MKLIDGAAMAQELRTQMKQQIAELATTPGLGIVLVGSNSASQLYVRKKQEAAAEVGVAVRLVELRETASKEEILQAVHALNDDASIHGIIVQLPLPNPQDADDIIAAIALHKDADGYHPQTLAQLRAGRDGIMPVMCRVVLSILEVYGPESEAHATATIVARNAAFAESLTLVLDRHYVEAQTVLPDAPDLALRVREAGIVIAAGSTESLITADMVEPGAVVIDIGIVRTSAGKTVGCVDFAGVSDIAGAITPVPGGVGPLTVAYLLQNVVDAATKARSASRE